MVTYFRVRLVMSWFGDVLPAEMLERVFRLLRPRDRQSVMAVCRRWREVGEAPVLWASLLLTLGEGNYRCLASGRFAGLKRVTITSVAPEVLGSVLAHPGLTEVTLEPTLALGDADPALLGNLVARMEKVNMSKVADTLLSSSFIKSMNASQLDIFFSKVRESASLKSLNMNNRCLAGAAPGLLAEVVAQLTEARLRDVRLTEEQASTVCSRLVEGSRLDTLVLASNNLRGVVAGDLAMAVRGLTSLNLANTKLTSGQVVAVFQVLEGSTRTGLDHNCQ